MKDQGIGSWPARRARMTPRNVALIEGDDTVTYADLDDRVRGLAAGLHQRGVTAGDRVAFLGLNSIAFVETMFAVARLGAIFVPVNTRLAQTELAYVLTDSGTSVLLHQDQFSAVIDAAAPESVTSIPVGDGADATAQLRSGTDDPASEVGVALDDVFMLQYTSGTSGRPKGVMLTHGNVTWNVMNLLVDVDLRSREVALVTAPMFHTAALNQVFLPVFLKGGTSLLEGRFDAGRAIELIEQHRVTMLFGVTSMYQSIAAQPAFADADLSSLTHALSGGAPIPESLLTLYADRGLGLFQGYGMTETSPGATMLREADSIRKLGTAGTPCFFSDVRVVDATGADVAVGQSGEVWVHGPNVSPGYWHNETATAATFTDGWVHSGDIAVMDDEGYVRIVDRLKDMYISGGENVYPAEVESAIYSHDAVAECAVIGVPDQQWGEVGRAFVRLTPGATLTHEELLEHLAPRLARYKLPRSTVFVADLPHNASGKLLRARLKEDA
ncbi:acyl-CoA synthetase [Branchiibius cervicis]|uniref:Long-chain fatty acid--CoA ligase n=1 Tax=Branchiibius cervicis TaxID=908252 RepID=A0ABW2AQI1_9MICO